MLKKWHNIYPEIFEKYATQLNELTQEEQTHLSNLLTRMEGTTPAQNCVRFIVCAHTAGVAVDERLIQFLSEYCATSGLWKAIQLFDSSGLAYVTENFHYLAMLVHVLTNPLCETIFDARSRIFSDYDHLVGDIPTEHAQEILTQLHTVSEEHRIQVFFDFFASLRPVPPSLKYLVEGNIAAEALTEVLNSYCHAKIAAINNTEHYLQTSQMIKKLQIHGGDQAIFEEIKYTVASAIEERDLYSTRTYHQLMDEIWQAFQQPQADLVRYIAQLENSEEYRQITAAAKQNLSLLKPPQKIETNANCSLLHNSSSCV